MNNDNNKSEMIHCRYYVGHQMHSLSLYAVSFGCCINAIFKPGTPQSSSATLSLSNVLAPALSSFFSCQWLQHVCNLCTPSYFIYDSYPVSKNPAYKYRKLKEDIFLCALKSASIYFIRFKFLLLQVQVTRRQFRDDLLLISN